MNTVKQMFCPLCMSEHEVNYIERQAETIFKDKKIDYKHKSILCPNTEEYYEDEKLIRSNNIAIKDAYRNITNLLTSDEIKQIREKYGLSQKKLGSILGWSEATIGRYETFQVQDVAHDRILRKIDEDPLWLKEMVEESREILSGSEYDSLIEKLNNLICDLADKPLQESILAEYACVEKEEYQGDLELNFSKLVSCINYFATNISDLYKTKLLKCLWYADFLHYAKSNHSITGLAYLKNTYGAYPLLTERILTLDGINYTEDINPYKPEISTYIFYPNNDKSIYDLDNSEISTLNYVIDQFKTVSSKSIVDIMHNESAYLKTSDLELISYEYAKEISFLEDYLKSI